MTKTLRITLITAISFAVYFILDALYFNDFREILISKIGHRGISHIFAYLIFGFPLFLGVILMHGARKTAAALGLDNSIWKGFGFALICTLPMLFGYFLVFDFNREITINQILINVFAAAFFEELYFRGFLFGQVYRYTKFGFIPALILGALLFAFIHLYQSQELTTLIGVFLTTFLGAVLFAWAYAEWSFNIWIPVFLHLFMNLFWLMFSVSDNAFGGIYANLFRIFSLILIISLTIFYKCKNRIPLEVNRKTIWMKNKV